MPTASATEATSSGTVARVTMLLRVLAEAKGPASLTDISERMKLPVSTTHRLLNLLLDQGFVERGRGSRVRGLLRSRIFLGQAGAGGRRETTPPAR